MNEDKQKYNYLLYQEFSGGNQDEMGFVCGIAAAIL